MITAAIKHRVKRIVVTSSADTLYAGLPKYKISDTYSESDFAKITDTKDSYIRSKIY